MRRSRRGLVCLRLMLAALTIYGATALFEDRTPLITLPPEQPSLSQFAGPPPQDSDIFCQSSDSPELAPTLLQYGLPPVHSAVPSAVAAPNCTVWGFKPRQSPALILDGFTFNGEYDVLLLRLFELEGLVDDFILVEAAKTFTNHPKPMYFTRRKPYYSRWLDRILHVTIVEWPWRLPFWRTTWDYEHVQRDKLMDGFREALKRRGGVAAHGDAVILMGDVDEIPSTEAVSVLKHCEMPSWPIHMYLDFWSNYAFKWRKVGGAPFKGGVSATTLAQLMQYSGPDKFRQLTKKKSPIPPFDHAGYHLGFYMCPQQLLEKLRSYSHTEYNTPDVATIEHMTEVWRHGKDWINGRPWEDCEPYDTTAANATLPAIVKVPGNRVYFAPYLN